MTENAKDVRGALRKQYIRARESLPAETRETYSLRAAERIVSLPEFRDASTVMLYRAVRGEISMESIPAHPASAGKRFVYPRCLSGTEIAAMIPAGWENGPFGIPEPTADSGTAFDEQGTRLGMGGGYYDRFLPRCGKAVRVMAAFEAQRAEELPADDTDAPMDIIVTEEAVRRIRKGGTSCG